MLQNVIMLSRLPQEMIDSDELELEGKCKILYPIYLGLVRIVDSASFAIESRLSMPLTHSSLAETTAFPSAMAKWVHLVNESFQRLDTAVGKLSVALQRLGIELVFNLNDKESKAAKTLKYHFHPKGDWLEAFQKHFRSGIISADGNLFSMVTVPLVEAPRHRVVCTSEDCQDLVMHKEVDISTDALRIKLIDSCEADLVLLVKIRDELANYIRAHCTIEDLL